MKSSFAQQCTDVQLVEWYQQEQDATCLGELYKRYYQKVYYYCLGKLKDQDAALDLTQDIFLKVAEKLPNLKNPVTFISWLFRIAHNECVDINKSKSKNHVVSVEGQFDLAFEEFDAEGAESKEHAMERIAILIQELPDDAKGMLLAKYLDGKSIQELQETYQLSGSAVKMRLSRAKQRIMTVYEREKLVA